MKALVAASVAIALVSPAYAAEPVGSSTFNTEPGFDLARLTEATFYDTLAPLAKKEGGLTFYDFTDSFGPLFNERLIPAFEAKYGVKVTYVRGGGQTAYQQLVAAINAGAKAPADAYFVSSGALNMLLDAGVIANVALNKLLPNAKALEPTLATVAAGVNHGGVYLPFHRNQTSIIYDTRSVPTASAPDTLDGLLKWAAANPKKLILTSPTGGGSGSGFLQSIAYAKVTGDACRSPLANFAITKAESEAYAGSECMKPVWDYYRALLPVVEITNGNSDTLNQIANGAGSIGTAWEDMTYDFIGRGLLPPTVRQEILKEGQVGGGDGMFLPVRGAAPASALLFLDFMMAKETQLTKLQVNGSRSARTDIDPAATFTPQQVARLIPTDQFATRAKTGIPAVLNTALSQYFVANVLRTLP